MFERFTAVALIATSLGLLLRSALRRAGRRGAGAISPGDKRWPAAWALAAAVVCGTSALMPVFAGRAMRGWWMLVHVGASPLLILGLIAVAARRAPGPTPGVARPPIGLEDGARQTRDGAGVWLTSALGVVTAGSMLLTMPAWFGQEAMATLGHVHRYSGVLLCCALMLHAHRAFVMRN